MNTVGRAEETLINFARGQLHWRDLSRIGIDVEFTDWASKISVPANVPKVEPSPAELANGMLVRRDRGTVDLRRWASVLLGVSDISLDRLRETPKGDIFLETLWDVSGGLPVSDTAWKAIHALANRPFEPEQDRIL